MSLRSLTRPAAAAASALLLGALAACGGGAGATGADGSTTLRYQGTPSAVQFPELAEDLGYFQKIELEWTSDTTSGPTSIQNVATGQSDFGSAFNGAVVKLADAGAPITAVVDSYGADDETFTGYYALESSGIRTAKDLIGKKVGMNTLGAHHESITREWLSQQGLSEAEIEKVELTVVPPVNTEQALRKGQIDVAALGGLFRDQALARGGLHQLYADKDLYDTFSYGTYVVRDDLLEKNPEAVEDFVQGVARAIRWAQVTPREEVVARYKKIITERGRAGEDPSIADFYKSSGIPVPGGVIQEDEISIWADWLERTDQLENGDVDVKELFTNEFNPYANGELEPDAGPEAS